MHGRRDREDIPESLMVCLKEGKRVGEKTVRYDVRKGNGLLSEFCIEYEGKKEAVVR